MNEPRRLLFIGSPHVRNIDECCEAGLKVSQISEYDATREFIFDGDVNRKKIEIQTRNDIMISVPQR